MNKTGWIVVVAVSAALLAAGGSWWGYSSYKYQKAHANDAFFEALNRTNAINSVYRVRHRGREWICTGVDVEYVSGGVRVFPGSASEVFLSGDAIVERIR